MSEQFKMLKIVCGGLISTVILAFAVVGVTAVWKDTMVKDYDSHLTGDVYKAVAVDQNVNLVFYRKGCPYCEAGKKAVITMAENSTYPTFYIDVESENGQVLVKKYQVEKAATLLILRDGKSKIFHYATKNKDGQIVADQSSIKEALDD